MELIKSREPLIGSSGSEELDRAWLFACVVAKYGGERQSWSANPMEDVFFPGLELAILSQLRDAGVKTVEQWVAVLEQPQIEDSIAIYARLLDTEVSDISMRPVLLVACFRACTGELDEIIEDSIDKELRAAIEET